MTPEEWASVVGMWLALWVLGYGAGFVMRWYQGISEKL